MTFGSLEVALPAFAQQYGSAGRAGLMLGTLAFGSLLGGIWYGARNWSRGLFIAPSAAASFSLVGRLAPEGAVTEAFTWLSTAVTAGFAAGGVIAGLLVEHVSVDAALLATAGCAVLAAVVLYARRATLRVSTE